MSPRIVHPVLFAVLAVLAASPASAAEAPAGQDPAELRNLPLEELVQIKVETVIAASRYDQKVTRAPAAITVVTAEDIKLFGYRTLAEILESVRGLYTTNDRNYSYLGLRGFLRPGDYNTRFLLLTDGHRMNDNVYDSTLIGTEGFLDVDLIDRVEVIRGPSSSVYGSNAFFGVINVVTKQGRDIGGIQASGEAGSLQTYKGRLTYGQRFENGVEALVSGTYYSSRGERRLFYPAFNDPAFNNGYALNSDEDQSYSTFANLSYQGFTLSGGYSIRTKNIPTASFATVFNDGREETTDSLAYTDLRYRRGFQTGTDLDARVYYHRYYYTGIYPYDYLGTGLRSDVVLNRDRVVGETFGGEWIVTQRLFERHRILAGVEYRENFRQFQTNFDEEPRLVYFLDSRRSRSVGSFSQAEIELPWNFLVNAGVRYDYFSSFGTTFNPRVALIYQPWETTTFKLLAGRAFRAPSAYEIAYHSPLFVNNPNLAPERIRTYEGVYEQYIGRNYRLAASAYQYETKNLISQVIIDPTLGAISFANVGKVRARGLELEAEARFASGFRLLGSYAIQRANGDANRELTNSPRHLLKFHLVAPLYEDKVQAGLEVLYRGSAITLAGNRANEFVTVNLTLFTQKLLPGLELSGTIYDLFDARPTIPGARDHLQDVIPQTGRHFRLKLTYTF